jgi:hypothetical protein
MLRDLGRPVKENDMHRFGPAVQRALERARRVPSIVLRRGGRSASLGALLLAASAATALATANTPPKITAATITPSVMNEGQTATLSVTFTDPDAGDLHTARIKWFDQPGGHTQVVQLPAGQKSFQLTHQYAEAPTWGQKVQVTVYDRQTPPDSPNDNTEGAGKSFVDIPVTVKNVAPSVVANRVSVQNQGYHFVVAEGDAFDPSTKDVLRVRATWSDPVIHHSEPCTISQDTRHFRCEHYYDPSAEPGTYAITIHLFDDDGGVTNFKTSTDLE